MTPAELQKTLQSDESLTIKQVKEIICEIMKETINKSLDIKYNKVMLTNNIGSLAMEMQSYCEKIFCEGQMKGLNICLDLLEKVGDDE